MKRALLLLSIAALAACSAAPIDEEASDDQAITGDSADGVLFANDHVTPFELTLAPDDVKKLSEQANAVQAQKISAFADRPKAKGTFLYKGPSVPVTPTCDVTKPYDVTVKIKGMASVQQLQQFGCNGGANQRFTMKTVAGGVQLVAKHSGKCVALGPNPGNGVAVVRSTCTGDRSQVWSLHGSMFE